MLHMKLDNYKSEAATDEKNFKYEDAIRKLEKIKNDYIEFLGSDHALVADVLVKLGVVYKKQQKYSESMSALKEARGIYAELVGYNNFLVAGVSLHLVDVYISTAKFEDASYILSRIRSSIINDKEMMYEKEFKTRYARRLFTYHIREANYKFNENPQDLILENGYIKVIRHFSLAKASEFFLGIIKEFYITEDWNSVLDQVKTSLHFFANKEELKISFVESLTQLINLNQDKFPKNILDSIYNLLHKCSNPEINQNEEISMKFLPDNDQITVEEMYKTYKVNDENTVICAALNYGARMAIPLKGNEKTPFNQAAKEIHRNLIQQGKISEENFVHHYECISIKCCINNENMASSTKEAKEDETFANMMKATRKRKIVERLEKYLDQSTQPEASSTNNQARLFKFRERENKMEVEAKKSLINAHLDVMNEIKASIRKR